MPVSSRSFAILNAAQLMMQKYPAMVFSEQGSTGGASRADGKAIDIRAEFGVDRIMARFGMPIDEEIEASTALFAASMGAPAMAQIPAMSTMYPAELMFNTAGKVRYMMGGGNENWPVMPLVINQAGGSRRNDAVHGEVGAEEVYAWMAGVKVIVPHKVYDVKGMLISALSDVCPTMFFNYNTEASADIPDEAYVVPIGKSAIITAGTDITIATYGPGHTELIKAMDTLTKAGIKAEYLDVRTLNPFDEQTLITSVKKTGRLLCTSMAHYTQGFTSHMIAVAAQEVPGAKFRKITWPDIPTPGTPAMLAWLTPDAPKIVDAAQKLLKA